MTRVRITPEHPLVARGGAITAWLATLVLAGVVALTWFGYRAANEWQSNAAQLIERRQYQVATSLSLNLSRDMRAVQTAFIDRHEWGGDELESPKELADVLTPVFGRYALPRSVLRVAISPEPELRRPRVAAARRGRLPAASPAGIRWFKNADVAKRLEARLLDAAGTGRQYSIFRLEIGGTEYQVVTRLLRGPSVGDSPTAVVGFMVNMDWARTHYFVPMIDSVMAGTAEVIETPGRRPDGHRVRAARPERQRRSAAVGRFLRIGNPTMRRLSAYFFDPAMANTEAVHDLEQLGVGVSRSAPRKIRPWPSPFAAPGARCWCSRPARWRSGSA